MQIHKHLPWQTSWQESVIIFSQQKERNIFKRKYIKSQALPISFLSSARLCHTLIHLFVRSIIMHVDPSSQQHPKARLCRTCWVSLKHGAEQVLSVGVFFFLENCILSKMSVDNQPLLYAEFVTGQVSQHRYSVEHQHHTGVLIRHTNNSVGGAATDVWNSHSD